MMRNSPGRCSVLVLGSVVCFLLLSPPWLFAQNAPSELELFWTPAELLVSATRTPKKVSRAPALATVVTAEQIRQMGARTLLDIVCRYPGFSVSINNIGNQVIDVRGLKSYHGEKVLLMIDGHRVNETHSGGTAWTFSDMPLDNVERIELIRGPGSALYGENAFAGVINVFTKRYHAKNESDNDSAGREEIKNFVSVGGGTQASSEAGMLLGKSGENWSATGFVNLYKTDGFGLNVEQDVLSQNPGTASFSIAPHETEDWQERQDIDAWLTWKELSLHSRYFHKWQGPYIGITDALTEGSERENEHFFAELDWKHEFGETTRIDGKISMDHHEFDNYWVGYPPGFLGVEGYKEQGLLGEPAGKFRSYAIELLADMQPLDNHLITSGAGARMQRQYDIRYWANFDTTQTLPLPLETGFQEVSSWGNWAMENRESNWYLFAQDDWAISDVISIITGIRYDDYEEFGDVVSPRAGMIWQVSQQSTCKLLYGHAFRAPSYVERFTINNPAYIGNPELKPETIDTIEGSVAGKWFRMEWDTGIYYSKYNDIIVLGEKPSPTEPAQYINRDNATAKGIELSLARQLTKSVKASANYVYQDIENDETGASLPGVPKHQGNVELQWEMFYDISFYIHFFWCGKREREITDSRDSLAGYSLVDLALLVRNIGIKNLELQLSINNLLDQDYEDPAPENTIAFDFPRPGINGFLEIKYAF
jgi:outer membrane cobalamin receptor